MNRLISLKNTKLGPLSLGQVIFWGIVFILAVGGFFFIRSLVTCWNFPTLPLPGSPPSDCGTVTGILTGPVIDEEGNPVATTIAPPPPLVSIPESELPPAWEIGRASGRGSV